MRLEPRLGARYPEAMSRDPGAADLASPGHSPLPLPPDAHPAISHELVSALISSQHPDLAALPVGDRLDGWDMAVFRLGREFAVRLPRYEGAVGSLAAEARWIPLIGAEWTFPTARILREGGPGDGYPWPWAVSTWLEGDIALNAPLDPEAGSALGDALREVHQPCAADAPFNTEQSVTMAERHAGVVERIDALRDATGPHGESFDADAAIALWAAALAAPVDLPRSWIHGDLHGHNVISAGGRFAGIIDWSDICGGDPAVDLGFLHTLLPSTGVAAAYAAYGGVSDATAARAHGIGLDKATSLALYPKPTVKRMGWDALHSLGVATTNPAG